jgi:choline dehydrogenase-like flavoprotein
MSQQRVARKPPVYDVVIIGSGAAGGTAAWALVKAGLRVAMLETGALRRHLLDFPYHEPFPYQDPHRGLKTPLSQSDEYKQRYSLTGSTPEEPYTTPEKMPYEWFRARNVGGRTMFWGRFSNRFNENDFRAYSRDGHGKDWPLTYQDLAPYYDRAELFMGVCGEKEGHPDLPDSDNFLPPVAYKCSDLAIKRAAEKMGIRTMRVRRAMLTKSYQGYPACHYCSGCDDGCETHSFYNSAFRQVVPLIEKYPRTFTLIPEAMAYKIDLNARGLASGVRYIDKKTGRDRTIRARTVVVACGTLESTRLLLHSQIANSNGMIGRNFMEHLDVGAQAYFPELFWMDREAGDGIGGSHVIIPWFGYFRPNEKRDFLRGFQIEPSSRIRMRPDKNAKGIPGFGSDFKREVRKWTGARVVLASHGEMLPSEKKYVELDPAVKDKWGIPVLRIHHPWEENDYAMYRYIRQTYEELFTEAKAVDIRLPKQPDTPGHSIHEMGTLHMGADARTSVLNQYNQSWEVRNLFVVDAAAFTSGTHKNPTLTIMALSWRASDYMMAEMKKGSW